MENMKLLCQGWAETFKELVESATDSIVIISPWIRESPTFDAILSKCQKENAGHFPARFYTRYSSRNFADPKRGSDPEAFKKLLETQRRGDNVTVYGTSDRLHGKVYIFDENKIIITSANLTRTGLGRNIEFGILLTNKHVVEKFKAEIERILHQDGDLQEMHGEILAKFIDIVQKSQRPSSSSQTVKEQQKQQKQLNDEINALFRSLDDKAMKEWIRIKDQALEERRINLDKYTPGSILEAILDEKDNSTRALGLHGFLISEDAKRKTEEVKFDIAGALWHLTSRDSEKSKEYLELLGFTSQADYLKGNRQNLVLKDPKLARIYAFMTKKRPYESIRREVELSKDDLWRINIGYWKLGELMVCADKYKILKKEWVDKARDKTVKANQLRAIIEIEMEQ